ncbi:hypothetical protein SKAU_G00381840 [Synaphobranchus kaupii]|uniref:Uncharacterized protein n=1 Tax=Synaphobranchus kaupii TaxID=118154 RepID=A0A9Q1EDU6_SYNKA|nr:hypothetical protein SKAU_G00381840 [Synaphobranchus kaupii]
MTIPPVTITDETRHVRVAKPRKSFDPGCLCPGAVRLLPRTREACSAPVRGKELDSPLILCALGQTGLQMDRGPSKRALLHSKGRALWMSAWIPSSNHTSNGHGAEATQEKHFHHLSTPRNFKWRAPSPAGPAGMSWTSPRGECTWKAQLDDVIMPRFKKSSQGGGA